MFEHAVLKFVNIWPSFAHKFIDRIKGLTATPSLKKFLSKVAGN